ncbi:GNAT family N-acetyltransferase [Billgrantia pellis]|uniref:tRNA(Met) cytidine acetyltransferase TmcA n=2 Tax=Billgrantia pellis TaxID=2606936 RepID=A0A7V7FWA5_9GAMM|nr:GNAT family N-acetyltransferase [Halomonas pellis]
MGWSRQMAICGWRGLVWLTADPELARSQALTLWREGCWRTPCWLSSTPPAEIDASTWLSIGRARTRLGQEHDLVVVDAVSEGAEFDPDAFGAISGTLRAGGLLVLLTAPPGIAGVAATSRYQARLLDRLSRMADIAHWPAGAVPTLPEPPGCTSEATEAVDDPACRTRDQAEAVARLVALRRRRPLVLTADRGRGKTAALGIACARLLAAGLESIHVTAPRPEAVASLFERLAVLCPRGSRQGNRFVDAHGKWVAFVAPDDLSDRIERGEAGGPGAWLLVDEAAAIPAALLAHWLEAFPRIAFATTLHGYEGSGRGFALRFRERLERRTPDWREFHLSAPVRWSEGDPLERLVDDLLLLDAVPPPAVRGEKANSQLWSRDMLACNETALRDIYGLLVQAHYRTTPADLRRLLDEPGLRIATLVARDRTQAVAVSGDEGGFDAELAERVARGERRLRGHLLAQSLAAHGGCREALKARLRRVQRIAVHPERRREGLGRHLLEGERDAAREAGVDLLGASFGAEPGLLAFWQALGFRTVRLGLSRETSTGEHAVMVLAPLSPWGEAIVTELTARFHQLLPALLAFELATLDPAVTVSLLSEGPRPALSDSERRDITDVAFARREPALARPALQALLRRAAAGGTQVGLDWLVAWAFQGRDSAWLASRRGLSGRREVDKCLRESVAALYAHGAAEDE